MFFNYFLTNEAFTNCDVLDWQRNNDCARSPMEMFFFGNAEAEENIGVIDQNNHALKSNI